MHGSSDPLLLFPTHQDDKINTAYASIPLKTAMCVCQCEMILDSDSILFLHHILYLELDRDVN